MARDRHKSGFMSWAQWVLGPVHTGDKVDTAEKSKFDKVVDFVAKVEHVQLSRLCPKWVIFVAWMLNIISTLSPVCTGSKRHGRLLCRIWLCRQCVLALRNTNWVKIMAPVTNLLENQKSPPRRTTWLKITNQWKVRILDFGLKIVIKQALMYAIRLTSCVNNLQSRIKPGNNKITVRWSTSSILDVN